MCVNPRLLTTKQGLSVEVACRKCWQCIANRQNDWVGRCIAEEQTSARTTVVHLTYGGDDKVSGLKTDLGASILIYKDVMLWLKRLRKAGFPLRFFCCGEYGELKGRSHWHVICFWQDKSPEFEDGKRNFADKYWPHGFTMTEDLRLYDEFGNNQAERAIRYVTKYLQKSEDTSQALVRMSKKPPLGDAYFRQLAGVHVKQGLLPQDAFYSFADVRKDGSPRKFKLEGASLDTFCGSFIEQWKARYGSHPLDVSHSDFLLAWCDTKAQRVASEQLERRQMASRPSIPPPAGYGAYRLWETRNVYVADPVDGFRCLPRLFWSYDEGGFPAWHEKITTAAEAAGTRSARIQSVDSDAYRRESAALERKRTL